MTRYRLVFAAKAEKEFRMLPVSAQGRIREVVNALAENPRPHGCLKMRGTGKQTPLYRIRSGDYRVIYQIHDNTITIEITRIGNRKNIYR